MSILGPSSVALPNVPNGIEIVKENKNVLRLREQKCAREAKMCIRNKKMFFKYDKWRSERLNRAPGHCYLPLPWDIMVSNCCVWPCMAFHRIKSGLAWRSCVAMCGLAIIDSNSFDLFLLLFL